MFQGAIYRRRVSISRLKRRYVYVRSFGKKWSPGWIIEINLSRYFHPLSSPITSSYCYSRSSKIYTAKRRGERGDRFERYIAGSGFTGVFFLFSFFKRRDSSSGQPNKGCGNYGHVFELVPPLPLSFLLAAWRIPWPSFLLYTDHAFHFPTSFYRFPIST